MVNDCKISLFNIDEKWGQMADLDSRYVISIGHYKGNLNYSAVIEDRRLHFLVKIILQINFHSMTIKG